VESLPDPFLSPARPESARATGTKGQSIRKRFAEYLPNGADASRRIKAVTVGSAKIASESHDDQNISGGRVLSSFVGVI
jgi:hypothetical protein